MSRSLTAYRPALHQIDMGRQATRRSREPRSANRRGALRASDRLNAPATPEVRLAEASEASKPSGRDSERGGVQGLRERHWIGGRLAETGVSTSSSE